MDALTLPATLDALSAIRSYVRDAAQQAGLEKKQAYRLQLAVDEIATNIVDYGYKRQATPDDRIEIAAQITPDRLVITIRDSAPPFDPYSRARPDHLEKSLEDRPTGGLGIFLAIENVDEYRYVYQDGCNQNIFTVQIGPHSDQP